jgi:glutathione synthase/RimK-type ligase-like ATP-grasp enzyme
MTAMRSGWLALATSRAYPDLPADEQPLLAALQAAGYDARPAVWDDPDLPWPSAAGVLIRSCWDYHLAPQRFRQWLDDLDAWGIPVLNPTEVIRGNLDKRYLLDLARQGCAIVPTVAVPPGASRSLAALLDAEGWDEAVIKPIVSGGAHQTWRLHRREADAYTDRFATLVAETGALVQPFLPEIVTDGEWSFVFFDRQLSHVVCKRPKTGDFRVQDIHGGSLAVRQPDPAWLPQVAAILSHIPGDLTYARLDGVVRQGRFLIMEVEVIEPNLYLGLVPEAISRLVAAIRRRI